MRDVLILSDQFILSESWILLQMKDKQKYDYRELPQTIV